MASDLGRIAVAIAGAGSRGIRVAGMAKAFEDYGLKYDILQGTSSGALNGCLWHQGNVDLMEELWMKVRNRDVYRLTLCSALRLTSPAGSFYDNSPMDKFLRKYVNYEKVVSNPKPFYIHTTSINQLDDLSLRVSDLKETELVKFLRASASVPMAFPPVEFRGRSLIDGGLVNNYSIVSAIRAGADTVVIMIPAARDPVGVKNVKGMLGEVLHIMMENQLTKELEAIELRNSVPGYRQIKTILIRPPVKPDIDFLNFDSDLETKRAMIKEGYNLAMETLRAELG